MPDIASILKSEITRLARKEARRATEQVRKAVIAHRSEIAALKRRADNLERALKQVRKPRASAAVASDEPSDGRQLRFSAKGFAAQRRRLGLSAHQCGLLLNTSGQSIYNWETGKARPRSAYLPAIAAMRRLGKREAVSIVESLQKGRPPNG